MDSLFATLSPKEGRPSGDSPESTCFDDPIVRIENQAPIGTMNTALPQSHRQPHLVTDVQFAHGLVRIEGYLPEPLRAVGDCWFSVARALYSQGAGLTSRFVPQPGVDPEKALRHIGALLRTPAIAPGQRDAAVACWLQEWFAAVVLEDGPSAGGRG